LRSKVVAKREKGEDGAEVDPLFRFSREKYSDYMEPCRERVHRT
jgi:hypothetical protein